MSAPERLELQPVTAAQDQRAVAENFRRIEQWASRLPRPTLAGSIVYWNGSAWVVLPPGDVGDSLKIGADGLPEWAP